MNIRKWISCVITGVLLTPYAVGAMPQVAIKDVINGQGLAPTMKLSTLPAEYKSVKIELAKGGDSGMASMLPMMMMAQGASGGGGGGMEGFFLGSIFNNYWTKADMVTMGGHEFLVTYKLELGLRSNANDMDSMPFAASLRLALVRTDMIASISPDPTATASGVAKLLKAAKIPIDQDVEVIQIPGNQASTAAILFPVFAQAKSAAKATATLSNAKQMALGVMIYMSDYDDVLPYPQSVAAVKFVTYPYIKNKDIYKTLNPNGGQFLFNNAIGGVEAAIVENPADTILWYESKAWPDGRRAVAFLDGHAKLVNPEEWKRVEKSLRLKLKRKAKPLPANWGKKEFGGQ